MKMMVVVRYLCEAGALESTQLQLIVFEGGEFGVCSLPTRDRRRKGTLSGSLSWRIIYELLNKFQVCQQAVTI